MSSGHAIHIQFQFHTHHHMVWTLHRIHIIILLVLFYFLLHHRVKLTYTSFYIMPLSELIRSQYKYNTRALLNYMRDMYEVDTFFDIIQFRFFFIFIQIYLKLQLHIIHIYIIYHMPDKKNIIIKQNELKMHFCYNRATCA